MKMKEPTFKCSMFLKSIAITIRTFTGDDQHPIPTSLPINTILVLVPATYSHTAIPASSFPEIHKFSTAELLPQEIHVMQSTHHCHQDLYSHLSQHIPNDTYFCSICSTCVWPHKKHQ